MNSRTKTILFALMCFVLLSGGTCGGEDTFIIGGSGVMSTLTWNEIQNKYGRDYETAVEGFLKDNYNADIKSNNSPLNFIIVRFENFFGQYLTSQERLEIHEWLLSKNNDELNSIYAHVYIAHIGGFINYTDKSFYGGRPGEPHEYIIPDGMSFVQYLQLLMTTSL